jgi:hypothetical protein
MTAAISGENECKNLPTYQKRDDRDDDDPHCPAHRTLADQRQTLATEDDSQAHEADELETVQEPADQCRPVSQRVSRLNHLTHSEARPVDRAISWRDARSGGKKDDAQDRGFQVQPKQPRTEHPFRELIGEHSAGYGIAMDHDRARRTVRMLVFHAAHKVNWGR